LSTARNYDQTDQWNDVMSSSTHFLSLIYST
jgi:hypothetical protein